MRVDVPDDVAPHFMAPLWRGIVRVGVQREAGTRRVCMNSSNVSPRMLA